MDGIRLRALAGMGSFDADKTWSGAPMLLFKSLHEDADAPVLVNTPRPEGMDCTPAYSTAEILLGEEAMSAYTGPGALVVPLLKSNRNPFTDTITVGRANNNDIRIKDRGISKLHAWFVQPAAPNGSWKLVDRKSLNGSFVNGSRISAEIEQANVRPSDEIRFGTVSAVLVDADMLGVIIQECRERLDADPSSSDHDTTRIEPPR